MFVRQIWKPQTCRNIYRAWNLCCQSSKILEAFSLFLKAKSVKYQLDIMHICRKNWFKRSANILVLSENTEISDSFRNVLKIKSRMFDLTVNFYDVQIFVQKLMAQGKRIGKTWIQNRFWKLKKPQLKVDFAEIFAYENTKERSFGN